ncbi:MAG TPA: glycosyltransferase [Clostridia bacterium]|nr:glycosyltransferase [Clostridia bacterium]HRX42700.1 glycosyltransferase [Clostridia bacterium]
MITAQFNDSFAPITDGVANGVRNYAYWLNRKYGKAYVVTPEFPGYEDKDEFEVIRYTSIPYLARKPYRLGLHNISFEARERLRNIPLDIIHARSPFSSGAFARQIAKGKNIPLVASFHSQYYYDIKEQIPSETITRGLLALIADFYMKADAVWTVSNKTAETLRSYGYVGDISVINNGTDMIMPDNYEEVRKKTGKELGIKDNEFVFCYVGQLVWHKNLKLIAHGLSELRRKGRRFKMVIVGAGDAENEFEHMLLSLGLEDNVIMTGQVRDREKLMGIYARADLFLFPSIYDTFGIVVREAAALKCPCVLIEGSNAAESVRHGINGYLCRNEVDSFTSRLAEVMDDRKTLEKVSEEAMKTLPEGWESIVDRAFSMYQDVIRGFKSGKSN